MAPSRRRWLLASPVLALALLPLAGNWAHASRAGQTATADWARDLLNSVEPYGILVTAGDNDTFPLWYAQEVEGVRRDVTVAVTSLLNTDWYVRQMIRRPVFEYDEANGPAPYRGRSWRKPTAPVLRMTIARADSIPPYLSLAGPVRFQHGGIVADIDPRRLPYGALMRSDLVVLQMLKDNLGERPMYFSRTTGGHPHTLGLGAHLLTQGLARKVLPVPPTTPGRDTLLVPGEGWVDIPRTRTLWDSVYRAPAALVREGGWVDRPSVGIPAIYVSTGLVLAEALGAAGERDSGQRTFDAAMRVAEATRITDWFTVEQAPPITAPSSDAPGRVTLPVKP